MAFILYKHAKRFKNDLSVSFYLNGSTLTNIMRISPDLCQKLDFAKSTTIDLYVDDKNPRLIMLKKNESGVGRCLYWNRGSCRLQLVWNIFEIRPEERGTSTYQYEITDDKSLIINFDKRIL